MTFVETQIRAGAPPNPAMLWGCRIAVIGQTYPLEQAADAHAAMAARATIGGKALLRANAHLSAESTVAA